MPPRPYGDEGNATPARAGVADAAGAGAPSPPATPPTLATRVTTLVRDARALFGDYLELAVLDAQRAATGLAWILSAAVVVSILVVSAWIALVAGLIVWATSAGVNWTTALGVAALLNLALAGGVVWWIRDEFHELLFSATLRQLRSGAEEHPAASQ